MLDPKVFKAYDIRGLYEAELDEEGAYANRNETKHLPYGEGTLRAEPLRDALAGFDRPATVISESPDEESTQTIGTVLLGTSAARRSS